MESNSTAIPYEVQRAPKPVDILKPNKALWPAGLDASRVQLLDLPLAVTISSSALKESRWRVLTATPKVALQDKTLSWPFKAGHPQLYEQTQTGYNSGFFIEGLAVVLRYAPDSEFDLPVTPAVTCWAIGIRLASYRTLSNFYLNYHAHGILWGIWSLDCYLKCYLDGTPSDSHHPISILASAGSLAWHPPWSSSLPSAS